MQSWNWQFGSLAVGIQTAKKNLPHYAPRCSDATLDGVSSAKLNETSSYYSPWDIPINHVSFHDSWWLQHKDSGCSSSPWTLNLLAQSGGPHVDIIHGIPNVSLLFIQQNHWCLKCVSLHITALHAHYMLSSIYTFARCKITEQWCIWEVMEPPPNLNLS